MGRKPNPLVAKYFERGQKLSDSSNRYPHTCRRCGERYPKGRNDTLIGHITKRCQAMSEGERIAVFLQLFPSGTPSGADANDDDVRMLDVVQRQVSPTTASRFAQHLHQTQEHHHDHGQQVHHGSDQHDAIIIEDHDQHGVTHHDDGDHDQATAMAALHSWSALEALAEASRQVDLSEKHDQPAHAHDEQSHPSGPRLDLDGHVHMEGVSTSDGIPKDHSTDRTGDASFSEYLHNMSDEAMPPTTSVSDAALTAQAVAVAATRLSPVILAAHVPQSPPNLPDVQEPPVTLSPPPIHLHPTLSDMHGGAGNPAGHAPPGQDSWGPISFKPILPNGRTALPLPPSRGGHKIDVSSGASSSGASKHPRAKFTPNRRKEVQEVRKMGACIRCKLLRKTCGPETPCSACCRVLSPRVWTTGCVRTKLSDQVELWSAGLQTLLVTNQINQWKDFLEHKLHSGPTVAIFLNLGGDTHPLDAGRPAIRLGTLSGSYARIQNQPDDGSGRTAPVMLDYETQDVGDCVETYTQQIFPELIAHEPQPFTKKVLETAQLVLAETEDELLRKALELWGLVELADRETCWHIVVQPSDASTAPWYIQKDKAANVADVHSMFSIQLSAAAERRANMASKSLLSAMQRILFDSKVKIGFSAYLACLVFVIAIEKEVWIFKAWEVPHLMERWPLTRSPEQFTAPVMEFPGVLRMILSVRRILPRTGKDANGKLAVTEGSMQEAEFFRLLDLDYDHVLARHEKLVVDNSNSRCLELHLASHLLLPELTHPPGHSSSPDPGHNHVAHDTVVMS